MAPMHPEQLRNLASERRRLREAEAAAQRLVHRAPGTPRPAAHPFGARWVPRPWAGAVRSPLRRWRRLAFRAGR